MLAEIETFDKILLANSQVAHQDYLTAGAKAANAD